MTTNRSIILSLFLVFIITITLTSAARYGSHQPQPHPLQTQKLSTQSSSLSQFNTLQEEVDILPLVQFWSQAYDMNFLESKVYVEMSIESPLAALRPFQRFSILPRENMDESTHRSNFFNDFRFKPKKFTMSCYDGYFWSDWMTLPDNYGEKVSHLEFDIDETTGDHYELELGWLPEKINNSTIFSLNCLGYFDMVPTFTTPHCCSKPGAMFDSDMCRDICNDPIVGDHVMDCCQISLGLQLTYDFSQIPSPTPEQRTENTIVSLQAIHITQPAFTNQDDISVTIFCDQSWWRKPCEDNFVYIQLKSLLEPVSRFSFTTFGFGGLAKEDLSLWTECKVNGATFPVPVLVNDDTLVVSIQYPFIKGWDYVIECHMSWLEWQPAATADLTLRRSTFGHMGLYMDDTTQPFTATLPLMAISREVPPSILSHFAPITAKFNYTGLEAVYRMAFDPEQSIMPLEGDYLTISLQAPENCLYQVLTRYPERSLVWNEPSTFPPLKPGESYHTISLKPFNLKDEFNNPNLATLHYLFILTIIPLAGPSPSDDPEAARLTPLEAQITWTYHRCLPGATVIDHAEAYPDIPAEICVSFASSMDCEIASPISSDLSLKVDLPFYKNTTRLDDPNPQMYHLNHDGSTTPLINIESVVPDKSGPTCLQPTPSPNIMSMMDGSDGAQLPFGNTMMGGNKGYQNINNNKNQRSQEDIQNYNSLDAFYNFKPLAFPSSRGIAFPPQPAKLSQRIALQERQEAKRQEALMMVEQKQKQKQQQQRQKKDGSLISLQEPEPEPEPEPYHPQYNYTFDAINPYPADYLSFTMNEVTGAFHIIQMWVDSPYLTIWGVDQSRPNEQAPCWAQVLSDNEQEAEPFCVPVRLDHGQMGLSFSLLFSIKTVRGKSYKVTCPGRHLIVRNDFSFVLPGRYEPDLDPVIFDTVIKNLPPHIGYLTFIGVDTRGRYYNTGSVITTSHGHSEDVPDQFTPGVIVGMVFGLVGAIIMIIILGCEIFCRVRNDFSLVKQSCIFLYTTPCLVLLSYFCCCCAFATRYRLKNRYKQHGQDLFSEGGGNHGDSFSQLSSSPKDDSNFDDNDNDNDTYQDGSLAQGAVSSPNLISGYHKDNKNNNVTINNNASKSGKSRSTSLKKGKSSSPLDGVGNTYDNNNHGDDDYLPPFQPELPPPTHFD